MKVSALSCVSLLLSGVCGAPPDEFKLKHALQMQLEKVSMQTGGTALSLGVALPSGRTISLSAGLRAKPGAAAPAPAWMVQPSDPFAMGSTAKMYTAVAVMRLVEAGKFGLDDKALPLLDDMWTTLNGTSIINAFGPEMKEVTVRHLLNMQSGIPDFDTPLAAVYQYDHPSEDLDPIKECSFVFNNNFSCKPGTCWEYTSTNYELLGLILAQQAGAKSWDAYTQAQDLPKDVLAEMPSTAFAVHGLCNKYTDVHGYSTEAPGKNVDIYNVSCTNGWTCGNLISNGADAAVFVRALLGKGERLVSNSTQAEMMKFSPLTKGWETGLPYGLGLMDLGWQVGLPKGQLVGHGGMTYGFNAMTAYARKDDFGLSVVGNTENVTLVASTFGQAYQQVLKAFGSEQTSKLDSRTSVSSARSSKAFGSGGLFSSVIV